jgi:PKHD-type hydroxylase
MRELTWHYYNALSEDAVDKITQLCLKEKLEDAVVVDDGKDKFIINKKVRRSKITLLDKQRHREIFELMISYALDCNKFAYGFDIDQVENCQFGIYDSADNGAYDWHIDTLWANNTLVDRKISIVIQLSDRADYEGGVFEIANVEYSPEDKIKMQDKGTILTFPSFLKHRVTPVTKGKRMSLIAWVEGKKFR